MAENWTKHARHKKTPDKKSGVSVRSLAVTYSHMGKPHTTIGAKTFHF